MKKVQIPSFGVWKQNAKWTEGVQNHLQAFRGFADGVTFANEAIEASEHDPKPWQPKPGDLCRTWGKTTNSAVRTGYFVKTHDGDSHEFQLDGSSWEVPYCALIETLDEIGKPPGYFISRGRCSVSKE